MITYEVFVESVQKDNPHEKLPPTLVSLWWDRKGDWARAHAIAQEIPTVQGSAVHAYLHREEGDLWNADYWYRRAGRRRPELSLAREWERLAREMLSEAS